jgi:ABC-type phosphate transport system substrate-binding protein
MSFRPAFPKLLGLFVAGLVLLPPLAAPVGAVSRPPGQRLLLLVGSNTLGEHAVPQLAKAWLEQEKMVQQVMIQSYGELIYVTGTLSGGGPVFVEIHATGSGDCFKGLIGQAPGVREACDIGMSSRRVKEEEADLVKTKTASDLFQRGKEPGEGCEHPVGMDGLAIIVHKSNPLTRVSFRELKSIYSRQVTDWRQLGEWKQAGGADEARAIVPIRRKEPSGTLDFFKERIHPEVGPMRDEKQIAAYVSSGELAAKVATTPEAIGFVGESYALVPGVKRLQVYDDSESAMMRPEEAVFPDRAVVRRALYPLSRFVYFYTPLIQTNPETKAFVRFSLSEEGQAVIADRGNLVPIEGTTFHITKTEAPERSDGDGTKEGAGNRKKKVILRLHGSNTVGAVCAVNLAFDFLLRKALASKRAARVEDETSALETPEGEKALAHDVMCDLDGDGVWETIEIRPTGSSDAFRSLYQGLCDVGMSSRPITDSEKRDLAKTCGDLSDPEAQFALGIDALAIVVAKNNPIEHLTIEQLRGIFLGEVANWSVLGGPDLPIHLHSRPERSGTCKSFCDAVLNGRGIAASAKRHAENSTLAQTVADDPGGIGYVPMSSVGAARVLKVGQEGSPTFSEAAEETVRGGRYPAKLRRHVYIYVPAQKPSSLSLLARLNWELARDFAEYSQTWRAQAIVASSGFITDTAVLDAEGQARRGADESLEKFLQRLRDLERKTLAGQAKLAPKLFNDEICPQLLFDASQHSLTAESRNILDRKLAAWLKIYPAAARRGFIAEGWADSDGTDEACQKVSLQRAEGVARYITESLGQRVTAVGRGKSFDPPNTDEDNKQLNRRVVVKLTPVLPPVAAETASTKTSATAAKAFVKRKAR